MSKTKNIFKTFQTSEKNNSYSILTAIVIFQSSLTVRHLQIYVST